MKTLGLTDNPFYPRKLRGGIGETKYLQTLHKDPLQIHQCAALEKLYFGMFPDAARHERRWRDDLRTLGYEPGETRPTASFVAILRGSSGCGKTTLAASFLRHLISCREPTEDWAVLDKKFPDTDITREPLTEADIEAVSVGLRNDLAAVGEDNWVCALIDNVTEKTLGRVLQEFDRAKHCVRVFVVASDDLPLLDGDGLTIDFGNYPVELVDYELGPVEPDAAIEYARFRIDHFRHAMHPSENLADAMFPLLASAIRSWVEPKLGQPNTLFVRQLNHTLYKKVDALLARFGKDDIRDLPPPDNVPIEMLAKVLEEL